MDHQDVGSPGVGKDVMDTATWIVIVLVVLALVVLVLAIAAARRKRTARVRDRFGPEYDRAVEEHGNRGKARDHLESVAERRDSLKIRALDPQSRERYQQRWAAIQTDFVDRPGESVDAADTLVSDVMRERGYPVEDFDSRSELVAADHPKVVQHYRSAHDALRRHHDDADSATTEELRRAMVHYRELVDLLVEDGKAPRHAREE
jgi:hypothetical protein